MRRIFRAMRDAGFSGGLEHYAKSIVLTVLLLASSVPAHCGDRKPKEYPLTLTIISTDTATSQYTSSQPIETNCTSDDFGHTNCSTTGGTRRGTVMHLTQTAEGSDGNVYTIQWASRAQGFGAGMASSSGAPVRYGAALMPGQYKARFDKHGLKLLIPNQKGEVKEHTFVVLSVRKKDIHAQPKEDSAHQ